MVLMPKSLSHHGGNPCDCPGSSFHLMVVQGFALAVSDYCHDLQDTFTDAGIRVEQFALIEASYVLIRFLQLFETIGAKDDRPWQEKIALTVSSRNGVRVSFNRAK